jgi:hypothetical protein
MMSQKIFFMIEYGGKKQSNYDKMSTSWKRSSFICSLTSPCLLVPVLNGAGELIFFLNMTLEATLSINMINFFF